MIADKNLCPRPRCECDGNKAVDDDGDDNGGAIKDEEDEEDDDDDDDDNDDEGGDDSKLEEVRPSDDRDAILRFTL